MNVLPTIYPHDHFLAKKCVRIQAIFCEIDEMKTFSWKLTIQNSRQYKSSKKEIEKQITSNIDLLGFEPKLINLEFIIYLPKLKVNGLLK